MKLKTKKKLIKIFTVCFYILLIVVVPNMVAFSQFSIKNAILLNVIYNIITLAPFPVLTYLNKKRIY